MGLVRRVGISVVRPFYRAFVERPLWWFLAKVKVFFFAETSERLLQIENRLAALEKVQTVEELFRRSDANNAAQWDALEQLLLALYRQPEAQVVEPLSQETLVRQHDTVSNSPRPDRVNGPHTIR